MAMSSLIPVAVYYRMSDDRQESSIERQKSQVIPYAQKRGYDIVREYTDLGISGDEIAKRREFQRMLRDAQAGHFQGILTDDKDRFGRFDSIDLGEIVGPLRRKGVWLEAVAQGRVDWSSFAGRITDAILQEAKNMEQEAISRRVLSSQVLKAQAGRHTGGRALYGYHWEPGDPPRMVPEPGKAEVVRLIFNLYDQGQTLTAVAEELRRRGIPSPKGRPCWTRTVIQRLLINRRYIGDYTWGVHPQGKRHRYGAGGVRTTVRGERTSRRNAADLWLLFPDHHEALVSAEQFERVQNRLEQNQTATAPQGGGGEFVLNKLLVCSHCGSFLNGVTPGGQRVYVCRGYLAHGKGYCKRNSVAEKPLLDFLLRKLQETFLDQTNLQKLREEMARQLAQDRDEGNLSRLRRQRDELESRITDGNQRLLILPADRLPGVIEQLRQWERERDGVRAELERIEQGAVAGHLERAIADAEACLWRLREATDAASRPLLRSVLREMISRVEMEWTHWEAGGQTRCRLSGGLVWLRPSAELAQLSPSASQ